MAEKTLFAFEPMSRMEPTTITRITASITAYSAMSCPSSSATLCEEDRPSSTSHDSKNAENNENEGWVAAAVNHNGT